MPSRLYSDSELLTNYEQLRDAVGREDKKFDVLMRRIESETTYLTSPASTKYHGCFERGLLEHSVSVALIALKIKKLLAPELSNSSVIKVALLHDLGKVGYPGDGNSQYIINKDYNPNKNLTNYNSPYNYNESIVSMPHAHRSVYLIQNMGYELTPEEFQAIISHDGQYVDDNKSYALKECKLAVILHYADLWDALYIAK